LAGVPALRTPKVHFSPLPRGAKSPLGVRSAEERRTYLLAAGMDHVDVVQLSIEQLLGSLLVDPRRHLDTDRVRRYSGLIDQLPPVTVFRLDDHTLLLADGYHRLAAAQAAGRTSLQADIRDGTKADAMQFAIDLAVREQGVSRQQAGAAIKRHIDRRRPNA
jgi:hypothetical protein